MNATLILMLGLALFLASHSVRIFADGWRTSMVARIGPWPWKGLIGGLSLVGFALLVWGFGATQADPTVLWLPPHWTHHLAAVLTLPAFVLVIAAYVPGNRIKSAIGHPMVAGVKIWALAHLLANGTLADTLLFGSFLLWAVLAFSTSRRRDRAAGITYPAGPASRTIWAAGLGIAGWAIFSTQLHLPMIGVRPFG